MISLEMLGSLLHNAGSAAEGSGAEGWLPDVIGGAVGGWHSIFESGVRGKILEQAQQQGTGDQRLADRSERLP